MKFLYGKYSGTELELEGVKYLIMRQSDVLAVLINKNTEQQYKYLSLWLKKLNSI